MRIRPYILAGGKSSRMGRDKAMLELESKTLLGRAVEMLRGVAGLGPGRITITIAGSREALAGADRSIVDRYPGCGPLGGIEAALDDLQRGDEAEWAFFVPVDMPLLRSELVDRLLTKWALAIASDSSIRACCVEVDGRPQPLVSLVHRSLHREVRDALETGTFKVVPVLKSAGLYCFSFDRDGAALADASGAPSGSGNGLTGSKDAVHRTSCKDESAETYAEFTNVNTEADLIEVAAWLKRPGWMR